MKLGFRPEEAAEVVGGPDILERMRKAGWLKPIIAGHRCVIFSGSAIAKSWARLESGETLPPLKRGSAK